MLQITLSNCRLAAIIAAASFAVVSCTSRPQATINNLKVSVMGEYHALKKLETYSETAFNEGYRNVGNMLTAMKRSTEVHMNQQLDLLREFGVKFDISDLIFEPVQAGSTLENLKLLEKSEETTHQTIYPVYASVAVDENYPAVEQVFGYTGKSAQQNVRFLRRAIKALEQDGSDWNVVNSWSVCPHCGSVVATVHLDENCKHCETASSSFHLYQ